MTAVMLLMAGRCLAAQQVAESEDLTALPDAPQTQTTSNAAVPQPQTTPNAADAHQSATGSNQVTAKKNCPPPQHPAGGSTADPPKNVESGCRQKFDFFYPFGKPPGHGQPLTSNDKLRIAASDVVDPFNLLTIAGTAAISVGTNPDSGYGPGVSGWVKNSATLLTEDMTGAFFVTYFIPSITKQDPRYYRMPNASIPRRIENVLVQPVWARSDKGGHMPNYGMLIGVPATVTLANVYVPGRRQGVWPTVQTSAIAIASAPLDNLVNEFLPDVAKHVSIRIVLIQKIVNHLTLTDGSS